jgi:serine O-acetyltransferase
VSWLDDLRAVQRNDPAARNVVETLLCHVPLHAIWIHRMAHWLHTSLGVPLLPRVLSVVARFWTGIEIHPGARIGHGLFIDHGSGIVIGETAEIGDGCTLFHNVTLGGTGKQTGKRHPTLEDGVYVGTGAVLLGPIRVGRGARIGANSFVMMHDVPADCTAVGNPARIVKLHGERVERELLPTVLSEHSHPVPDGATLGAASRGRSRGAG